MNQESLNNNGITHIINLSRTARCNVHDNIEYLCIGDIAGSEDMAKHLDDLDQAVDFAESARKSGGKVLSHCWHGKNRSVSLLVAYLMKYEGFSAEDANNLIKETRPQAAPYWEALDEYAMNLEEITYEKQEQKGNKKIPLLLGVISSTIIIVVSILIVAFIRVQRRKRLEAIAKENNDSSGMESAHLDDIVDDEVEVV